MMLVVGLLGSFLILISWLFGFLDEYKSKKNLIQIKFSLINLIGVSFLLAYAVYVGEMPFIVLNGGLFIFILVEVIYSLRITRRKLHAS